MNPPNETIYINNLPDKMKKEDLKMSLYHLFSQFGAIVDIVAMKTPHTRGQAFVIYRNVQNATTALKALQGFTFFKRELRIAYAKVKSEAIERLEGTFKKKNAKLRRREREAKEREHIKCIEGKAVGGIEEGKSSKRAGTALDAPPAKRSKQDLGEPNATLLLSNFPRAILKQPGALKAIFSPFPGLKESRIPPATKEDDTVVNAFIEYETEAQASVALASLVDHPLTEDYSLDLCYAKK